MSFEWIKASSSLKWPWTWSPTVEDLKGNVSRGFLDPTPKSQCSWAREITTSVIRQAVYKICSVHTTSAGIVTDQDFNLCDLSKEPNCTSKSGIVHFVPLQKDLHFLKCPLQIDSIDLGVLEGTLKDGVPDMAYLSATKTKRLFYWTRQTIKSLPVCIETQVGLSVFRDDGGYLISIGTLSQEAITPATLFSPTYLSVINSTSTYKTSELQKQYENYMTTITSRLGNIRTKRDITTLTPLQAFLVIYFGHNLHSNPRPKRDITPLSASLGGKISDLQMSFLRSEIQHDFWSLTGWLNNKFNLLYDRICQNKIRDWVQDTINHSPPHNMIKYLSDDPFMLYIPNDQGGLVCVPKIVPSNTIFYVIDSIINVQNYLKVKDTSGVIWELHPHTGLLTKSNTFVINSVASNNFLGPI